MLSKNAEIAIFVIVITVLILLLTSFIILIFFLYKRKQINYLQSLEIIKNDYEKNLLSAQLEIKEQTLIDISRDIHDNIGLSLSLGKLLLNTIHWHNTEDIRQKVSDSVDQLTKAIDDLRDLTRTLGYDFIAEFGLEKALELDMKKISRLDLYKTGIEIKGTPGIGYLKTEQEIITFRIVQEALNNSIKHAGASELSIVMEYSLTHVCVEVRDNGKEWKKQLANGSTAQTGGSGLKNMQHRARMLNGSCTIRHDETEGTTVSIAIPVDEDTEA